MDKKSLAVSFGDSLNSDIVSCLGEYAELGVDSLLKDGLVKDIPFISTAVSLYGIGKSVRERHLILKLASFLNEINQKAIDKEKLKSYRDSFHSNEQFRNQQLEYILILLDRYIGYDKPQMLAKLYLAYLDGEICWEEFCSYAEIVDRFLLFDFRTLVSDAVSFLTYRNAGAESILRLVALGLMAEESNNSLFESNGRNGFAVTTNSMFKFKSGERKYQRTEFGERLANILRNVE